MHLSHFTTTLALGAAFFSPIAISAAEGHEHAAGSPAVINTVCPMDGKEIENTKAHSVLVTVGEGAEAKQFRLAMCSQECHTEFKKDPVAALKPRFGKNAPGPKTNFK